MNEHIEVVSFDIGNTLCYCEGPDLVTHIHSITGISCTKILMAVQKMLTKPYTKDQFVQHLCSSLRIPCDFKLIEGIMNRPTLHLYEDVLENLKILKSQGYVLISLSNVLSCNYISLPCLGLDIIDRDFASCHVGYCKPQREIFEYVQNQYGLSPDKFLHIGDSLYSDIDGAVQVGWNSLYIQRNTYPFKASRAIKSIRSISEVVEFLA